MKKLIVYILAVFVSTAMICQATTIGFVGAAGVNADIPVNYVSYAAGSGTGWTVLDGSGATPDIGLVWNSGDSDWEFHNSGNFGPVEDLHLGGGWDTNANDAITQLDGNGGHLEIKFSAPSGIAFILNSFDLGNALDQHEDAYGYNITLTKDSDGSTNWSYTTALYVAGSHETITANTTGDSGESYTLNFDRYPDTSTFTQRTGLDNLSFSQIPTKANTTIIGFAGVASNVDIPVNYCGNVTESGIGWTTAGTPNINLTWPGANVWEFHTSGNFGTTEIQTIGGTWDRPAATSTAIAQMQGYPSLEINFTVSDSGSRLVLNSFDYGHASDQPAGTYYGYDIFLIKDSDGSTNWSYSTPDFYVNDAEHITANAVGDFGEDYTLNFEKRPGTQANGQYSALDNLSFSEDVIPEPCVLSLIALIGGGIFWIRRKSTN